MRFTAELDAAPVPFPSGTAFHQTGTSRGAIGRSYFPLLCQKRHTGRHGLGVEKARPQGRRR